MKAKHKEMLYEHPKDTASPSDKLINGPRKPVNLAQAKKIIKGMNQHR